jgi:hypothetical protein
MAKKSATTVRKGSKSDDRKAAKEGASLRRALTKNRPGPVREGPDYLRRREEWFRSRSGDKV